jgi:hypothetical protein
MYLTLSKVYIEYYLFMFIVEFVFNIIYRFIYNLIKFTKINAKI